MAVVSNNCNGSIGSSCKVYLEYKINSQDIANNKSNITLHLYGQATTSIPTFNLNGNCKANIKINGTTKKSSTSLSMDFRNKNKVEMLTWTGDVAHDAEGKLTITILGDFDTNGPTGVTGGSVSKSWTLTTIPRTSSVTCADGNIGSATTININRASSSFVHVITYNFNGLTGTIANMTSYTSIGWVIPTTFFAKIPNAMSGKVTITCQTYSGDTLIGTSTTTANVFVVNSNPTVSATVVDTNVSAIELTGDSNKLIRYISNAKVTITATPKNSATISSSKVTSGSKSATTSVSTLNGVDSGTFNVSCVDSRGLIGSAQITKTLINYIKPVITELKLERPTTTSNIINANISGQIFNGSFGAKTNEINLKYRYKEAETSTWGSYIALSQVKSGNTFSCELQLGTNFNYEKSYDFEFVIADCITSDPTLVTITRGKPIVDIGKDDVVVNGQIYMGENKVLSEIDVINKIATGVEYATDEFIDGKRIYKKHIDCGNLAQAGYTLSKPTEVLNVQYLKAEGMVTNGSLYMPINSNRPVEGTDSSAVGMYIQNDTIIIQCKADRSSFRAYVDIYYIKN